MEKTRVPKGEKYWHVIIYCDDVVVDFKTEMGRGEDYARCDSYNYFATKEEADSMANKLRAVLAGADVIEMPSEEDASFESVHLLGLSGHDDGERREEAYLDGFADCLHWLKSKVK